MAYDILIVDDETDIREMIAGILDDEGYGTRTASDSDTALAAIMELTNAASDYLRKCSPEERAGCEGSRAVDAEVAEVEAARA